MTKFFFRLFCFLLSLSASAQPASDGRNNNLDKHGLAIDGYDPVSYFTLNKAVEGKKEFSITQNGATYFFATAQNRDVFKSNPARYIPQYGGWCAYAMGSTGEKVSIDPETYKIIDGKLYLFYNRFLNNTKKSWDKDEARLKMQADKNWQKLNK